MDGPPIFIITTAVGGFDDALDCDGDEVAKVRRDPEANKILINRKMWSDLHQVRNEVF